MLVDTAIKNCRIVGVDGTVAGGIAIDNGKIIAIAKDPNLPSADRYIDAKGRFVIPGVIDPHVHYSLYRPFEEDCKSETKAAVAGGITTEALMTWGGMDKLLAPYKEKFDEAKNTVERHALANVVFIACLFTDQHIQEIPEYARDLGITQFKHCMFLKGRDAEALGLPSFDDAKLYSGLEIASTLGPPAISMIHAENVEIYYGLKEKLLKAGRKDLRAWTEAKSSLCEAEAVSRVIAVSDYLGAPIYLVHISSRESLDIAIQAQARGSKVTVETCPHYLSLSYKDFPDDCVLAKCNPPLRDERDIERLWWGIQRGHVHCIGTDHCASTGKGALDIWSAPAGLPGLETLLPVMLSEGVNKGRISMEKLVEVCCYNPAKVLGILPQKGTIAVGSDADLVIVDSDESKIVKAENLCTASDFTPYEGRELKGWPVLTMVGGNVVMEDGEIVGRPGVGKYIPRKLF
ncbi:MAG: amidohydrolase family protein [Candidatus Hadarchaeum sp.]